MIAHLIKYIKIAESISALDAEELHHVNNQIFYIDRVLRSACNDIIEQYHAENLYLDHGKSTLKKIIRILFDYCEILRGFTEETNNSYYATHIKEDEKYIKWIKEVLKLHTHHMKTIKDINPEELISTEDGVVSNREFQYLLTNEETPDQ